MLKKATVSVVVGHIIMGNEVVVGHIITG